MNSSLSMQGSLPPLGAPRTDPAPLDWVEEVPSEAEAPAHALALWLRIGIVAVIVALILLTRFGVNTGAYGLNFAVPIVYVMILKGLADNKVHLDLPGLLLFTLFIALAGASLVVNVNVPFRGDGSMASLMLLASLYLPFIFVLKPFDASREGWLWTLRALLNITLFVAAVGILQFYLQFAWHPTWLFDFTPLIPKAISADVLANSQISAGSFFKSNGFFLREPSAFSFLMAFSLICEMALFHRWKRLGVYAFALLLSYSGTGLLALAVGLLFPFGFKTAVRVGIIAIVALLVFVLFGDALNLSFTLGRVGEFGAESSSGYIRYVAPIRLIYELVDSDPWTAFLGHGPGTIFHAVRSYEFHDPTWAKLVFEYGILGAGACLALMVYGMSRSHAPVQIRATLFFSWLVQGGHLLTPENVLMIYILLAFWPPPGRVNLRGMHHSTMPMTTQQFDDKVPE